MARDKIAGVPVVPSNTVPDPIPVPAPAAEPPKRTKPVSKGDPELQTMARIDRQLSTLPLKTQERIVSWIHGRMVEKIHAEFDERCKAEGLHANTVTGDANGTGLVDQSPSRGPDNK